MLNVIYEECHYAKCRYAECHYAECHGATTKALNDRTTLWTQIPFVFKVKKLFVIYKDARSIDC
jgi:hypothetical protein